MDKNRSYNKNVFIKIHGNEAGLMEKFAVKKNNLILERFSAENERNKCTSIEKLKKMKCRK
jgi:hypothetical protein